MTDPRPTKKTRTLIDALLALKMVSTFWNCIRFPAQGGYDNAMHAGRAVHAGLKATRMEYDPPLYYFVNLPTILLHRASHFSKEEVDDLMTVIEYSNLVYLLLFYVAWIYIIFPRVLPGARSWAVASVILLALPGYQKLAAMVHSDNMLAGFTAGTFACWLWLDQRRARFEDVRGRGQPYRLRALFGLAVLTGVTGLTRPFAVLPVALFSLLALREAWAVSRPKIGRFVARAAPLMLLVGVLSGSWYVYRWKVTRGHVVLDAYNHSYMDEFQPYKPDFDFKHYYTSFYFKELFHTPNRNLFKEDHDHGYFPTAVGEEASEEDYDDYGDGMKPEKNIYANSFFTLLYSEVWGDQWLRFSGRGEEKLLEKRVILVGAMPLTIFLVVAWPLGLARSLRELVRRRRWASPAMIVLAMTLGAAALYLWWQTHPGLLPGKNSTVKFIYIAYAVPFALAMCMSYRMRRREYRVLLPLCLLTYALAIPIAFYWDSPKKPHHRRDKHEEIERPVETRLAIPPRDPSLRRSAG